MSSLTSFGSMAAGMAKQVDWLRSTQFELPQNW